MFSSGFVQPSTHTGMSDDNDLETWVIRGCVAAICALFMSWLMSRIKGLETAMTSDREAVVETNGRMAVLEAEVKKLSESESRNSQAISKIAESTTRIEGALLGFGGKGGLINTMESLAAQVQELTHNRRNLDA